MGVCAGVYFSTAEMTQALHWEHGGSNRTLLSQNEIKIKLLVFYDTASGVLGSTPAENTKSGNKQFSQFGQFKLTTLLFYHLDIVECFGTH